MDKIMKNEETKKDMNTSFPVAESNPTIEKENINVMPDETVGIGEMNDYGYSWEGMLPLGREKALELFDEDVALYLLYHDGTESIVDDRTQILEHDGIYGIEKDDWERYTERKAIEQAVLEEVQEEIEFQLKDKWSNFVNSHADMLNNKENGRKTLVINAFGGAGAGKTTACLEICQKLKKAGFVAEYVQEYAKELVWEENWEQLDGTQDHQFEILQEQLRRMDRLYGKVDFVVTDAPIILNAAYNKELTPLYEKMLFELYGQYNSFNFIVERDVSKYEQEGRIQTLEESIEKDNYIKGILDKNNLYYGVYNHSTVSKIVDNAIITFSKIEKEERNKGMAKEEVLLKVNELEIGKTYKGSDGYLYKKCMASEIMKLGKNEDDFVVFSSTAYHGDMGLWDYENRADTAFKNITFREESIEIERVNCAKIDEWQKGTENYIVGEYVDDDGVWYLAKVKDDSELSKGEYSYEFGNDKPSRDDVESIHINTISAIAIDCHEEEFGADGHRNFPNLNNEPNNEGEVEKNNINEAGKTLDEIKKKDMSYLLNVAKSVYEANPESAQGRDEVQFMEYIKERAYQEGYNNVLSTLKDTQSQQYKENLSCEVECELAE